MAKLLTYMFIVSFLIIWYFLLYGDKDRNSDSVGGGGGGGGVSESIGGFGVAATNGHGSPLEGRDRHHHERGGHIRSKLASSPLHECC